MSNNYSSTTTAKTKINASKNGRTLKAAKWLGEWEIELNETGRVSKLSLSFDDIWGLLNKEGKDIKDPDNIFELLQIRAFNLIDANPEKYKPEPDYSALEWD